MAFLYLLDHCTVFSVNRFVYGIVAVETYHRTVGRDLYNVKAVYLLKFSRLGKSSTRHTRKL